MGTRVPIQNYNIRPDNSFIGAASLHDLNAVVVDSRPGEIDGIRDVNNQHGVNEDLENDDESSAVDRMQETFGNGLPLHSVGLEEDHSSIENNGSSRCPYDMLTIGDIAPIETARARFLQIIVDYFLTQHVIEVADEDVYTTESGQDKINKRKTREVHYEGDPRFALPLMYVANMYETLVSDVNIRLASLNGIREKTIGVALEAAGGLYRKLAKKFPKRGPCKFKRRELATSLETRTRFPELVIQEEKRVRFVVVNGLDIVEKPNNISIDDAEWFKRLTGRNETAISPRDYKYYSPRHKYRRVGSNSVSNTHGSPSFTGSENSSDMTSQQVFRSPQDQHQTPVKHHLPQISFQPLYHTQHQNHHQSVSVHRSHHAAQYSINHQNGQSSHIPEISHPNHSPTIPQHMVCLQPLTVHGGGRLHVLPTSPAKFCDECGAMYLRESSKFCSECGVKRLGT